MDEVITYSPEVLAAAVHTVSQNKKWDVTEAVTELQRMIAHGDANGKDAMELSVRLKRMEEVLAAIRDKLLPYANAAFQAMNLAAPDKKQYVIGEDLATVAQYAARSTWTYPAELVKLSVDLKAKQKTAQTDKTATKSTPTQDPSKNSLFAITTL